jgi:hypothetical protein
MWIETLYEKVTPHGKYMLRLAHPLRVCTNLPNINNVPKHLKR